MTNKEKILYALCSVSAGLLLLNKVIMHMVCSNDTSMACSKLVFEWSVPFYPIVIIAVLMFITYLAKETVYERWWRGAFLVSILAVVAIFLSPNSYYADEQFPISKWHVFIYSSIFQCLFFLSILLNLKEKIYKMKPKWLNKMLKKRTATPFFIAPLLLLICLFLAFLFNYLEYNYGKKISAVYDILPIAILTGFLLIVSIIALFVSEKSYHYWSRFSKYAVILLAIIIFLIPYQGDNWVFSDGSFKYLVAVILGAVYAACSIAFFIVYHFKIANHLKWLAGLLLTFVILAASYGLLFVLDSLF